MTEGSINLEENVDQKRFRKPAKVLVFDAAVSGGDTDSTEEFTQSVVLEPYSNLVLKIFGFKQPFTFQLEIPKGAKLESYLQSLDFSFEGDALTTTREVSVAYPDQNGTYQKISVNATTLNLGVHGKLVVDEEKVYAKVEPRADVYAVTEFYFENAQIQ